MPSWDALEQPSNTQTAPGGNKDSPKTTKPGPAQSSWLFEAPRYENSPLNHTAQLSDLRQRQGTPSQNFRATDGWDRAISPSVSASRSNSAVSAIWGGTWGAPSAPSVQAPAVNASGQLSGSFQTLSLDENEQSGQLTQCVGLDAARNKVEQPERGSGASRPHTPQYQNHVPAIPLDQQRVDAQGGYYDYNGNYYQYDYGQYDYSQPYQYDYNQYSNGYDQYGYDWNDYQYNWAQEQAGAQTPQPEQYSRYMQYSQDQSSTHPLSHLPLQGPWDQQNGNLTWQSWDRPSAAPEPSRYPGEKNGKNYPSTDRNSGSIPDISSSLTSAGAVESPSSVAGPIPTSPAAAQEKSLGKASAKASISPTRSPRHVGKESVPSQKSMATSITSPYAFETPKKPVNVQGEIVDVLARAPAQISASVSAPVPAPAPILVPAPPAEAAWAKPSVAPVSLKEIQRREAERKKQLVAEEDRRAGQIRSKHIQVGAGEEAARLRAKEAADKPKDVAAEAREALAKAKEAPTKAKEEIGVPVPNLSWAKKAKPIRSLAEIKQEQAAKVAQRSTRAVVTGDNASRSALPAEPVGQPVVSLQTAKPPSEEAPQSPWKAVRRLATPGNDAVSTSIKPEDTTTLGPKTPPSVSEELIYWCKSSFKQGLSPDVNHDELLQLFLSMAPGPEANEFIAESIYTYSTTLDGRRFAHEFLQRRRVADASLQPGETWTSVMTRINPDLETDPSYKVVTRKKYRPIRTPST